MRESLLIKLPVIIGDLFLLNLSWILALTLYPQPACIARSLEIFACLNICFIPGLSWFGVILSSRIVPYEEIIRRVYREPYANRFLASFAPTPENFVVRVLMILVSTVLVAIGIFFYVPADIMPLAGEGAMLAIAQTLHKPFSTIKICFDVSMVILSLVTCLICLHALGSVGLGTVIAAFLVGLVLKRITALFGVRRDKLLGLRPAVETREA